MALHLGRRGPGHQARVAGAVEAPGGEGPDPFDLGAVGSAALATTYASGPVIVSGLAAPAGITVSGGEYAINGGAWTASAGLVSNGDAVRARGVSAASAGAVHNVTVTIGGVADAFSITTVDHVETSSLVLRFVTDPGEARRGLIDACIGELKAAGVWSKLDALYLLAAHDAQAAQRNWIQDAFNLAPSGAAAFTTDRGYAGDGTSAFLDTGFNDLTGSALWSQDSLALGAYINLYAGGSNPSVGLAVGTNLRIGATTTGLSTRIHGSSYNPSFANPLPGHLVITRDGPTSSRALRNGATVGTSALASTVGSNASIVAFRSVSSYNADRMACLHIGGFLTPAEVAALYDAILAYLTQIGAN